MSKTDSIVSEDEEDEPELDVLEVKEVVKYSDVVSNDCELWLFKVPKQDRFDLEQMDKLQVQLSLNSQEVGRIHLEEKEYALCMTDPMEYAHLVNVWPHNTHLQPGKPFERMAKIVELFEMPHRENGSSGSIKKEKEEQFARKRGLKVRYFPPGSEAARRHSRSDEHSSEEDNKESRKKKKIKLNKEDSKEKREKMVEEQDMEVDAENKEDSHKKKKKKKTTEQDSEADVENKEDNHKKKKKMAAEEDSEVDVEKQRKQSKKKKKRKIKQEPTE